MLLLLWYNSITEHLCKKLDTTLISMRLRGAIPDSSQMPDQGGQYNWDVKRFDDYLHGLASALNFDRWRFLAERICRR